MSDTRARTGLILSPAPHLGVPTSSAAMAWLAVMGLLPAAAWGALLFGIPALLVIAAAVGSSLAAELLTTLPMRRFTLHDGSALLTGLIVGVFMPPGVPLYVPAAAAAFAILVVKQSFGGLGRNWMNPAMGGVLFALISWGAAMAAGGQAAGLLGEVATASPLEALRAANGGGAPLGVLSGAGYRFSDLDGTIVGWVNSRLLSVLGASLQPGTFDLLIGRVYGGIGAVSVPLLLLGAAFLIRRRVVRWQVPTAYVATFALLSYVFGGLATGQGWLAGGVGFHLFSGSLIIGAFFVAVDPVTSPLTVPGGWIYGIILGVLTFILRFFGSLGDGVAASIVLGNCVVPLIDRGLQRRPGAPGMAGGLNVRAPGTEEKR
jgi:Na+-translocating ferredoxin:NAD+ oxidoreductase subunit D